jgi:hypothetical protein
LGHVPGRLVLATIFGIGLLGFPSVASAHEGDGRAEVLPAQVAPGDRVTVLGVGLAASSAVDIELVTASGLRHLGSGTTDAEGAMSIEVTLPPGTAPRYYELHAADATGFVLTGYVEVLGPVVAETAGPSAPGWLPWLGLAAAALGAAVLVGSVRRRRTRLGQHRRRA